MCGELRYHRPKGNLEVLLPSDNHQCLSDGNSYSLRRFLSCGGGLRNSCGIDRVA
jgi:hypothetical protein